jgi:hypothetical protein
MDLGPRFNYKTSILETTDLENTFAYVSWPLSSPLSLDDSLSLQATAFLVIPVNAEKETLPKVKPMATAIAIINLLMNNLLF